MLLLAVRRVCLLELRVAHTLAAAHSLRPFTADVISAHHLLLLPAAAAAAVECSQRSWSRVELPGVGMVCRPLLGSGHARAEGCFASPSGPREGAHDSCADDAARVPGGGP